ncbi:hypothetical protein JCM6882_004422 [Rhodosporidiobolus microsporus]
MLRRSGKSPQRGPLSLNIPHNSDPPPPPVPSLPPPSPPTPLYSQFSTTSKSQQPLQPPKPIKVAALPRTKPPTAHPPPPPPPPQPDPPTPPAPPPVIAGPSMDPQQPTEDGPLFRAHLASLEKRSTSVRNSLKKLQKAVEASLSALQANATAQANVDDALEELGAASLTSQSEVLGGLYERELRGLRDDARARAQGELERGKELSERVKGAVERIKVVEERRKAFEADSKKYYDELAKYLARGAESDATKTAAHDSKQAERAALFRQQRIEYFAFLEGLVESEEGAVAAWLRTWADVAGGEEGQQREQARQASLDALEGLHPAREPGKGRGSAGSSKDGWVHVGGLPDYVVDPDSIAVGEATTVETDSGAQSTSGASTHAVVGEPSFPSPASSTDDKAARRRRRSSIPHFHLPGTGTSTGEREREPSGGTRDRLKGFLKSATNSIQSALPASTSSPNLPADLFRRPSPPPPVPSPPPGPATRAGPLPPGAGLPRTSPLPSTLPLAPAPSSARPPPAAQSQLRRKEGFLFATETGQKHTTAGDGGAKWARYWVTLAEGQLVEYDKWQDAMSVHGTPINLRYATARISKNTDRRFSFEVLTPQLRRVFQAASEKECEEWVAAISRSIESLLQGTSSVRHFDASRLTGQSTPYSLNEFGSSTSLARLAGSSSSPAEPPTSPKSRLPDFLSRRSSLGHGRKISTSKKDKRRSIQSPPIPSLTIGEETARQAAAEEDGAAVDRSFFDPASRRGLFAFSEGSEAPDPPAGAARPTLNGLGIPFPAYGGAASKSSPDLLAAAISTGQRSISAPFPGGYSTSGEVSSGETASTADEHFPRHEGGGDEDRAESASQLSAQDRAITEAVRGWASSDEGGGGGGHGAGSAATTAQSDEAAKYRNAVRIAEVAERGGDEWQNDRCADCREAEPRWASWSLGITLCIRCSGVHRSLGTHVSKVRSIELDDWNDEQLAQMEAIGNARSNAFFEARLPAGTIEALDDSTIAAFIREKYSDKKWSPLPDVAATSSSQSTATPIATAV